MEATFFQIVMMMLINTNCNYVLHLSFFQITFNATTKSLENPTAIAGFYLPKKVELFLSIRGHSNMFPHCHNLPSVEGFNIDMFTSIAFCLLVEDQSFIQNGNDK